LIVNRGVGPREGILRKRYRSRGPTAIFIPSLRFNSDFSHEKGDLSLFVHKKSAMDDKLLRLFAKAYDPFTCQVTILFGLFWRRYDDHLTGMTFS
jgi:hypothetical protein